jgi:GTP 3',8-cyclase
MKQPAAREWSDPFNSFNSLKGLLYRQWMEGILAGEFLPPIEASIDPVYRCNVDCTWCNSRPPILHKEGKAGKTMSRDHLLRLTEFLGTWGVRGACYAGGGEPYVNRATSESIVIASQTGMESAMLTNGSAMTEGDIETAVDHCRWIGVSIDTSNRDNYAQIKQCSPKLFDRSVRVLRDLVTLRNERKSRLEISFKFLIHPQNAHTVFDSAQLAKDIGVDYIHIRPAASENIHGGSEAAYAFPVDDVQSQVARAFDLEDENFRVFGIRHKFSPSMNLARSFSRCLASALLIQLGADGNCYVCVDHRGKNPYVIGRHDPDPTEIQRWWGGKEHRRFIADVDIHRCPRCTFGPYNEIMERVIESDAMCMNFP